MGKDEKWGEAVVALKKAGKVDWYVKVNAGRIVRLGLEYDMRFPAYETVVGG